MRAVSLFSGGLDSQIAAKLILEQGIEVYGVHFTSPFFGGDYATQKAASHLGIKLIMAEVGDEYLQILKNPVHGFGKNHNPCIDCHAFMLRKAGQIMQEIGASFIITGEVLGQRPMSQTRPALNKVDKLAGLDGLILRPLSALLLPETIPEINGWVDRSKLLDISGRSRSRQMKLAAEYGIEEYPTPAGGCLLTQDSFSRRLERFMETSDNLHLSDLHILKPGRHFYLDNHLFIVGRNQGENETLEKLSDNNDYLFKVIDRPGPLGLLKSHDIPGKEILIRAAEILARYSDAKNEPVAKVKLYQKNQEIMEILEVVPLKADNTPTSV